jgi:DNA repair exonuclease SbcCD ATPase subunit
MIITDQERQKRIEDFISKIQKNQSEEIEILTESGEETEEKLNLIPEEKKKTLTEILCELDRLDSYCDDQTEFDSTMIELKQKVESIVHVLRRLDNRIQELSADISELTRIKKVIENKKNNLEDYLKTSLSNAKFNQISTNTFDVKIKPSTALVVDKLAESLDLTRDDVKPYVVCKTTYQFDKNKIKDDMKYDLFPEELKPYFYISSEKNLNFKFRR